MRHNTRDQTLDNKNLQALVIESSHSLPLIYPQSYSYIYIVVVPWTLSCGNRYAHAIKTRKPKNDYVSSTENFILRKKKKNVETHRK